MYKTWIIKNKNNNNEQIRERKGLGGNWLCMVAAILPPAMQSPKTKKRRCCVGFGYNGRSMVDYGIL